MIKATLIIDTLPNGMVMGVVTFDNGQVLRFDPSAKFSGKAEDLGLKSE